MRCYNHRDLEAIGICKSCGIGVCPQCGALLKGELLCPTCRDGVLNKTTGMIYKNNSFPGKARSTQELIKNFGFYLKKFNEVFSKTPRWETAAIKHIEVIGKIRQSKDFSSLLGDNTFLKSVYETVDSFGMNSRKAKMKDFNIFKDSILRNKKLILQLHPYELENFSSEDLDKIQEPILSLFFSLDVMEGNSKLVGVSKTMAHLLPDLISPMDRGKINFFFYGNTNLPMTNQGEGRRFWELMKQFHFICQEAKLTRKNLSFEGFNSSIPKIIDNAIWGFLENNKGKIKKLAVLDCFNRYQMEM